MYILIEISSLIVYSSKLLLCLKSYSGTGFNGKSIYLRDIWPTRQELHTVEEERVISSMFKELKEKMEVRVVLST